MERRQRPLSGVGLLLVLLIVACAPREDVVATVGGASIEVGDLQQYIDGVTDLTWQSVDERVASRLLDQLLDAEVVLAAARDLPDVEVPQERMARVATVRTLLRRVCGDPPAVAPGLVDEELARRLARVQPARAHVRQMLLENLEEARAARARVIAGESFDDVSRDVSRAPNAEAGGELGFVQRGTLPEELDGVIFSLPVGQVSSPVEGPAGYHLFQVLEVLPEGPVSPARAELEARQAVEERSARDFTRSCVDRLADEVGVEVLADHLWFSYDGRFAEAKHEG